MRTVDMDLPNESGLTFAVDGKNQKAHHTWFRGENCNFNPTLDNLKSGESVLAHVVKGWAPPAPLIDSTTSIVAFGSCFAANITSHLAARRYNVLTAKEGAHGESYVVRCGEGMVNSFVIRQQFEWAFENKVPGEELWHGLGAEAFGYDEGVRVATKKIFDAADLFIITLGLSEIWYDAPTGGVFWRAVPRDRYDPDRHKFRVSTVEENKENLRAIYALIRAHRPEAKVIFTLSPIPLVATFRNTSCITANAVSKAVLRIAIDEVHREIAEPDSLFYWPSYEIVMEAFDGQWKNDRRHVKPEILSFIMTLFEHVWCRDSVSLETVNRAWREAEAATRRQQGRGVVRAVRRQLASIVQRVGGKIGAHARS